MKPFAKKRTKGYFDLNRSGVNKGKKTRSGARAISSEKNVLKKQQRAILKMNFF